MENYRVQNSCMNCFHVFEKTEFDTCSEFYCHVDGSERPPCGSVAMDEDHNPSEQPIKLYFNTIQEKMDIWNKWAGKRVVSCTGICDNWK